jgi:hypothetical protein
MGEVPVKPSWARFTLMDSAILIASSALGMSFMSGPIAGDTPSERGHFLVVKVVGIVLLTGVFSGPLILFSQVFRGRRSTLSLGEWLWLAPGALWLVAIATLSSGLREAGLAGLLYLIAIHCCLSVFAFCLLLAGAFRLRREVPCRWTDFAGSLVCTAVGPIVAFAVIEALGHL